MNGIFKRILFSHLCAIFVVFSLFPLLYRYFSHPLQTLAVAAVLSVPAAVLFSILLSRMMTKRLKRIARDAKAMARGEFGAFLPVDVHDEIGMVESALSDAARSMGDLVGRLEDEKGRMEAVLASMGEGVIVTDRRGTVTLANRKATELFGLSLTGKGILGISRDSGLHDLIEEGMSKLGVTSGEITLHEPQEMILSVAVSPLIRGMKVSGTVIVFHDITTLKRLERMRKDFVANVSHELKTPLTSIAGFAETLLGGALEEKENAKRFVETIRKNAVRLSRLVDDLLTLSNIELGKIDFDIRPVNLSETAKTVLSTLSPKAERKGLELKICLPERIMVMADRDRLEQVLLNLVDNAVKFTEQGSVSISAESAGGKVKVTVADTGIGIPDKDLPRLGERFYRVDPARSRRLGGTGLGLAIVKHLVISMGGEMTIESGPGDGTRVTIALPSG